MVAETLARPGTTPSFATADEYLGLAEPDGVAAADLDLWRDELAAFPTASQGRPGPRARAAGAGRRPPDPPGASRPTGATPRSRSAVATSTGIARHRPPDQLLRVGRRHRRRGRRHPDRRRLLGRPRPRRTSTSTRRPADAVDRATRLLGASKPQLAPAHRRPRAPDHRHLARHPGRDAQRRGGAQGPVAVRRPARRGGVGRRRSPWSTTRPIPTPTARPATTPRAWPAGATC